MPERVNKKPTEERSRYHHGDLRQAILEAACEHLRGENADTLSLRALARKIGVSQTARYRHFESRNALFAAIATWGFHILERDFSEMLDVSSLSAKDAMIELGMTYLRFAEKHPEKYQLCFDSSLVEFNEYTELLTLSSRCFDQLLTIIRRGINNGEFAQRPEEELAAIVWSGMHGLAGLTRTSHYREDIQERAVGRAINYLSVDQRGVITAMMNAISASRSGC